jgi:hypothetical protein
MDPGDIDPCPKDLRNLNFLPFGDTAHMHSPPVVMFDPLLNAWTIFVWGENQQLHKWKLSATAAPQFIARSQDFASSDVLLRWIEQWLQSRYLSARLRVPHGDANLGLVQVHIVIYDPVHN